MYHAVYLTRMTGKHMYTGRESSYRDSNVLTWPTKATISWLSPLGYCRYLTHVIRQPHHITRHSTLRTRKVPITSKRETEREGIQANSGWAKFILNISVFTARAMLCAVYAKVMCLSVCLCVSVCVSVSVTSRSSTKMAKHRNTQTTPHDSPGTQTVPQRQLGFLSVVCLLYTSDAADE